MKVLEIPTFVFSNDIVCMQIKLVNILTYVCSFELRKRRHYPIIPFGMRYNIFKNPWKPGHQWESFTGLLFTLWFPISVSGNCKLMTHRLATIHELDQPTVNQPTTSRHGLSHAPITVWVPLASIANVSIFKYLVPCSRYSTLKIAWPWNYGEDPSWDIVIFIWSKPGHL